MSAPEAPKETAPPKEEKKPEEKPKNKFTMNKFGGQFGKLTPAKTAGKDNAAGKDEAVDDSHTEAPSSAAEQVDPDQGEDALFNDKAVLYRFDKQNNEWKERGTGYIKILKNKESKKVRVLMRRNQTFKVCANHFILPYMQLKANNNSDRAFLWNAVDFADGTESHDTLSVKFKNAEVANAFKKAFEDGKAQNAEILKTEGQ